MDIFGITFATIDLWLLGIAGALCMWLLNTVAAPAIKQRREAATEFRSAFDGLLLNLTENPRCALAIIAYEDKDRILAAISKFRGFVPFWRRGRFERDVADYKAAYDVATDHGVAYAVGLSEEGEVAKSQARLFLRRGETSSFPCIEPLTLSTDAPPAIVLAAWDFFVFFALAHFRGAGRRLAR